MKLENPIFSRIYFLNQAEYFPRGKIPNSADKMCLRVNVSLQKYTFCKNWRKIVGQSWFGTRIWPMGLTFVEWSLSSKIKISTLTFSLAFVKIFNPNQTIESKNIWWWPTDRQIDDRQTTDRWQRDIFKLTPFHM